MKPGVRVPRTWRFDHLPMTRLYSFEDTTVELVAEPVASLPDCEALMTCEPWIQYCASADFVAERSRPIRTP